MCDKWISDEHDKRSSGFTTDEEVVDFYSQFIDEDD